MSTGPSSPRTPLARAGSSERHTRSADGPRLVLRADNYNSVNGLREFARSRGAVTQYVPFGSPDLRVDDEAIRRALARRKRRGAGTGRRRGLFAYPAQSNFSGVQHPLR
jgi:selenocysteine lyase/cysteine desulfurase